MSLRLAPTVGLLHTLCPVSRMPPPSSFPSFKSLLNCHLLTEARPDHASVNVPRYCLSLLIVHVFLKQAGTWDPLPECVHLHLDKHPEKCLIQQQNTKKL